MVAKTFQTMTQLGQPYSVGGKMYVRVRNEKTGTERQVRWYSDAEYAKLYPEDAANKAKGPFGSQHDILGFAKGYITIFKGDTYPHKEWFSNNNARYCVFWGWYIVSTEDVPSDIPEGITPVQLSWDLVGTPDGELLPADSLKKVIDKILYTDVDSPSTHQGAVGDRLILNIEVISTYEINGAYGVSTMHTMRDEEGNIYLWTTASKNWTPGTKKRIRGTVKKHGEYKGVKQTVLTRCMEVK